MNTLEQENKDLREKVKKLEEKLANCRHDRNQAADAVRSLTEGEDFGEVLGRNIIENQAKIIESQSNVIEILKEENEKLSVFRDEIAQRA